MRKSEKKVLTFSVLITFLILILGAYIILNHIYKKYYYIENGNVVAIVNKVKIYENDIKDRLSYLTEESEIDLNTINPEMLKAVLLEAYIDDVILSKFYKEPFDKQEIDTIVLTYKKRVVRDYFLKNNVIKNITEEDLQKKYDDLTKNIKNREERKISHILVETEDEADRIRKNVIKYSNFGYQANKSSLDKISAINNGDLGYLLKEEIALPEFAEIAFMLKKGEISKPVHTSEGWHIIKVEDIRETSLKSFEETKDVIKSALENELVVKFLDKLTKNADIELTKKYNKIKIQSDRVLDIDRQIINELITEENESEQESEEQ